MLSALVDEARPQVDVPVVGTDATGTIQVTLAPDWLPVSISLDPAWRGEVGAQGLAGAVSDACREAITARLNIAGSLDVEQLMQQINSIVEYMGGDGPPPAFAEMTAQSGAPDRAAPAIDRLLRESQARGDDLLLGAGRPLTGAAASGRLTLTARPMEITCEADADWVGRQETDQLAAALASAVASLRADRDAAMPSPPAGATPEALLAEARARLLRAVNAVLPDPQ